MLDWRPYFWPRQPARTSGLRQSPRTARDLFTPYRASALPGKQQSMTADAARPGGPHPAMDEAAGGRWIRHLQCGARRAGGGVRRCRGDRQRNCGANRAIDSRSSTRRLSHDLSRACACPGGAGPVKAIAIAAAIQPRVGSTDLCSRCTRAAGHLPYGACRLERHTRME